MMVENNDTCNAILCMLFCLWNQLQMRVLNIFFTGQQASVMVLIYLSCYFKYFKENLVESIINLLFCNIWRILFFFTDTTIFTFIFLDEFLSSFGNVALFELHFTVDWTHIPNIWLD